MAEEYQRQQILYAESQPSSSQQGAVNRGNKLEPRMLLRLQSLFERC